MHRSDESGTTQNFTDYLHATAPDVWTEEAAQAWPDAAGGEGAQGTSGVVAAISAGEGSVGYADASQVGELGRRPDQGRRASSSSSARRRRPRPSRCPTKTPGRSQYDVSFKLDRTTTEAGVYPITLVSYHIVCLQYDDQAKADLVKAFMAYVGSLEPARRRRPRRPGSAPMTAELMKQVATAVEQISAG